MRQITASTTHNRSQGMTGFTLYETLRIFVPGALSVLLINMTARVAMGVDPFAPDGGAETLVSTLESVAVFAVAALMAGLLLYLIDFPSRVRISWDGDARYGSPLPSHALKDMLGDSKLPYLSLYFLLSDRYLSTEMHKRVYLFGSLFRVFVDLRVLLALAAVAGSAVSLTVSRASGMKLYPMIDAAYAPFFVALLAGLLIVGSFGVFEHRSRYRRRRFAEEQDSGEATKPVSFAPEVISDLRAIWRVGLTILVAAIAGCAVVADGRAAWLGWMLLAVAFVVWLWVEQGPVPESNRRATLRASIMGVLVGERQDSAQFSVAQRLMADLALLGPMLAYAINSSVALGRQPRALSVWGVFMLPCVAIMAIRKHELRLLNIYTDQVTWLELNRSRVEEIIESGTLPEAWD